MTLRTMLERSQFLIRRFKDAWDGGLGEVLAILVLVVIISLAALAIFQASVSEVLVTVSHSV